MYVLLEGGKPIGTAFAVQCNDMKKLITAGHNIHDTKGTFSIAPRVEIDHSGCTLFGGGRGYPKRVEVVSMNPTEDWAVLRLLAMSKFTEQDSIPLCPMEDLERIRQSDHFWVIHCPVETFTADGGIPCVEANMSNRMYPIATSLARNEIYLPIGLWKGCSGGVVVDSRSRAVAIHITSTSTAETLKEAAKKSGGDDTESDMVSVLKSHADSHASYTTSRLLSCCDELLAALEM